MFIIVKTFTKWFILLLCCFVVSTFAHEVGHGVSNLAIGKEVSTGFNKVGMPYKKPSDPDFRAGFTDTENPRDMRPNTTLILAVVFTVMLSKMKGKHQTAAMVVGSLALSNGLIRLVPMVHSYWGYITRGYPYMEDEIGTGLTWYNINHIGFMKYLPSVISIVISAVCLYFAFRGLKRLFPTLLKPRSRTLLFSATVFLAYAISFVVESVLDNFIRINWV